MCIPINIPSNLMVVGADQGCDFRGLAARASEITPGQLVFRVNPAIFIVHKTADSGYGAGAGACCYCSTPLEMQVEEAFKCPNCNNCYCGESCKSRHNKLGFHYIECAFRNELVGCLSNPLYRALVILCCRVNTDRIFAGQVKCLTSHLDRFRKVAANENDERIKHFESIARTLLEEIQIVSDLTVDDIVKLMCTLSVNGFCAQDETLNAVATVFDPLIALINHECDPNCFIMFRGRNAYIRASRLILPGEQLTVSYTTHFLPYHKRRKDLVHYFFFECFCMTCLDPLNPCDALICKSCKCLYPGPGFEKCSQCEYKLDFDSTDIFLAGIEKSVTSTETESSTGDSGPLKIIQKALIAIRVLVSSQIIPFSREPFYSLFEILTANYLATGQNENAFLSSMAVCSRILPSYMAYPQSRHVCSPLLTHVLFNALRIGILVLGDYCINRDQIDVTNREWLTSLYRILSLIGKFLITYAQHTHGQDSNILMYIQGNNDTLDQVWDLMSDKGLICCQKRLPEYCYDHFADYQVIEQKVWNYFMGRNVQLDQEIPFRGPIPVNLMYILSISSEIFKTFKLTADNHANFVDNEKPVGCENMIDVDTIMEANYVDRKDEIAGLEEFLEWTDREELTEILNWPEDEVSSHQKPCNDEELNHAFITKKPF